jgi:uncharacterized protein
MAGRNQTIQVKSLTNQALISDKCYVAECFLDRLRGLIGRRAFEPGDGMLFPKCNDVHMWFMKIPIDVIFLKKENQSNGNPIWKVSSTHQNVRPWKPLPLRDAKASDTLELPAGTIQRCEIRVGDELCLS